MQVFANPTAAEVVRCDQGGVFEGQNTRAMGGRGDYLEGIPDRVVGISADALARSEQVWMPVDLGSRAGCEPGSRSSCEGIRCCASEAKPVNAAAAPSMSASRRVLRYVHHEAILEYESCQLSIYRRGTHRDRIGTRKSACRILSDTRTRVWADEGQSGNTIRPQNADRPTARPGRLFAG